jgi:hypothetical protein
MSKARLNATTRIINALGRNGPMTSGELNDLLGITSSCTRIYEINKMYRNFKIAKNNSKQYYLRLMNNIHVDHKKVYPNLYR